MMIDNLVRGAVVFAAAAIILGACNSQTPGAQSNSSGRSASASAALTISPDRSANLTRDGDTISIGREKSGRQGVILTPGPMRVTFNVEGEGVQVQVRQRRETLAVPGDGTYSVMLGDGGASHIFVTSTTNDNFSVTVADVAPCGAEGVECTPVAGSAAAPAAAPAPAPADAEPLRD
jgi:hypothetical protein